MKPPVRFELARGVWVSHDGSLTPRHKHSGWDYRCAACHASIAYVESLLTRMK